MASVEAALIAALKADSGVAALVSGRVFIWGGKQGEAYPYVTIQRISTAGAEHLNGPTTLEWPRIQIDVWSPVGLDSVNAAEAIRTAIDSQQLTQLGTVISPVFQDQRGPAPDEETRNYRVSQDYLVFHER